MDNETRIYNLERDVANLRDRLGAVEDKASSAWHTIKETQEDVGDLYDKIDELDRSVKAIMASQRNMDTRISELEKQVREVDRRISELEKKVQEMSEDMKIVKSRQKIDSLILRVVLALLVVSIVVSLVFFIYIFRHDKALASELLTFGMTVTKTIV